MRKYILFAFFLLWCFVISNQKLKNLDKYDRQMFTNFALKTNAPVNIVKGKNDSMSIFSDYSTCITK